MYSIPVLFSFYPSSSICSQLKQPKVLINQFLQFFTLLFRNFLHNIFQMIHIVVPGLRIFETNWRVEMVTSLSLSLKEANSPLRKFNLFSVRESSQLMVVGGRDRRDKARPIPLLVDMVVSY